MATISPTNRPISSTSGGQIRPDTYTPDWMPRRTSNMGNVPPELEAEGYGWSAGDYLDAGYTRDEAAVLANPNSTYEQRAAATASAWERNPNKASGGFLGLGNLDWKSILAGTAAVAGAGLGYGALAGEAGGGAGMFGEAGAGSEFGYGGAQALSGAAPGASAGAGFNAGAYDAINFGSPAAAATGLTGAGAGAARGGFGLKDAASLLGIASGANTLLGGSGAGKPNYTGAGNTIYTPTGSGAADVSWQQMLSNMFAQQQGVNQDVAGPLRQSFQNQLGIDPSALISAGDQAGAQYGSLAGQMLQYQARMDAQAANAAGAQNALQRQGDVQFGAGAGMQGKGAGMQGVGLGIMGNAAPLYAAGNAAFSAGQDPQSALYARTVQQLQDQSRAATSARGIGMSPVAAGIEGDTMSNFNIDWQNQQLQRLLSGLSGMGGAYNAAANQLGAGTSAFGAGTQAFGAGTQAVGQGGNLYGRAADYGRLYGADTAAAAGFGAQQPAYTLASGQVPFETKQAAYAAPANAATTYAGNVGSAMMGPEAGIMGNIIPYLNYGAGAGNYAASAGLDNAKFGSQQQQLGMSNIIAGMQNLNSPGGWLQGMQPNSTYPNYASNMPTSQYDPYGGNLASYQNAAGWSLP